MRWCIRCGRWFTPRGKAVVRSASIRGEFHEPEDIICEDCIKPIDMIADDEANGTSYYD